MNYLARLRGITTPPGGREGDPRQPEKNPGTPIRGTDKTDKSPFCQFKGLLSVPDFGKKPQPDPQPSPAPVPAPPCETWAERAAVLEFDGGLIRAEAEEQATCRRWLIQEPEGWRDSTFTPPASRAELRSWYPAALALVPCDDKADPWGGEEDPEGNEPGHPQEEDDPGAAFYRDLFRGMEDAPRCHVTLSQAETHRAVVAGLIRPEEARGAVLLATRDPSGDCALLAIPSERWDPFAALALLDGPVPVLH